ncbi:MAG: hypothetical protein AAGC64_12055 [Bacteroidota bacterium]
MNSVELKIDNIKNGMAVFVKIIWKCFMFIILGILSLGISSCNNDDEDSAPVGDGQEKESAFIYTYLTRTPEGEIYYISAHEDIPSQPDISNSVELGFNNTVSSYGEYVYVYNWDAATITRWEADRVTLKLYVTGLISLANTGISGEIGPAAFVSETRAFYSNLAEGIIVEWNPTAMEIVEVHTVAPLPSTLADYWYYSEWSPTITKNDKILYPIQRIEPKGCCEYIDPAGAMVGVFDLNSNSISYNIDDRLFSAEEFLIEDEVGNKYVLPARRNSIITEYYSFIGVDSLNPNAVLKINDDGAFDQSFNLDLSSLIPIHYFSSASFVFNNKIVLSYVSDDNPWPESYDNVYQDFPFDQTTTVIIDMETEQVEPFTGFNQYVFDNALPFGSLDGVPLIELEDDVNGKEYILKQNSIDNYTLISQIDGGGAIQSIDRLW